MSTEARPRAGRAPTGRFLEMKREGQRIVAMTAYDVLFARLLEEAGVEAVKLEGGHALGGYRVQGRGDAEAARIRAEAHALQEAGVFSMVLELLPADPAREISESLTVPTIGIWAGAGCDGQVLVRYDALGLNPGFTPKFLERFASLHDVALDGVMACAREVRDGTYPDAEHSFEED